MHVHADWVILEPVDEQFRPVLAGEPSATVLLTNLANHIQPVIRYDLGDSVLTSPERCPCGSRLTAVEVIGRTNEVLSFATAGGDTVDLLPRRWLPWRKAPPVCARCSSFRTDHRHLLCAWR